MRNIKALRQSILKKAGKIFHDYIHLRRIHLHDFIDKFSLGSISTAIKFVGYPEGDKKLSGVFGNGLPGLLRELRWLFAGHQR